MAEHLTRIEQIEEDLARAKIRRERFRDARILDQLNDDVKRLKILKAQEIKILVKAVRANPDLDDKIELLLSIPGIGERTALALLIRMPELGTLSREQAAALLGIAPFVHESGRYKGERHTGGGLRWNPALVALYKRLVQKGKPHALAIIACVRKLISYANTVIAKNKPWKAAV